jgi:hypothetical protein
LRTQLDLGGCLSTDLLDRDLGLLLFEGLQLPLHISESSSQRSATVLRGAQRDLSAVQLAIIAGQRCFFSSRRVARHSLFGLGELRRETFAVCGSIDVALHRLFGIE